MGRDKKFEESTGCVFWRVGSLNPRETNEKQKIGHLVTSMSQLNWILSYEPITCLPYEYAFGLFKEGIEPVCEDPGVRDGGRFYYFLNQIEDMDVLEHWRQMVTQLYYKISTGRGKVCGVKVRSIRRPSSPQHLHKLNYVFEIWTEVPIHKTKQQLFMFHFFHKTLPSCVTHPGFNYEPLCAFPSSFEEDFKKRIQEFQVCVLWYVKPLNLRKYECTKVVERNRLELSSGFRSLFRDHPISKLTLKYAYAFFKDGFLPVCEDVAVRGGGRFYYYIHELNQTQIWNHWTQLEMYLYYSSDDRICGIKVRRSSFKEPLSHVFEIWTTVTIRQYQQSYFMKKIFEETLPECTYHPTFNYEPLSSNPSKFERDLEDQMSTEG